MLPGTIATPLPAGFLFFLLQPPAASRQPKQLGVASEPGPNKKTPGWERQPGAKVGRKEKRSVDSRGLFGREVGVGEVGCGLRDECAPRLSASLS